MLWFPNSITCTTLVPVHYVPQDAISHCELLTIDSGMASHQACAQTASDHTLADQSVELRWQFWLNSPFFLALFGYPVILPSPCGVPYKTLPLLQTLLTFHSSRTCSPGTGGCPFPHGCSPLPPPLASNLPSHQCPPPCDPKAHPLHRQGATGRQQHASCSATLPATHTAGSACGVGTAVMSKPGQAPPAMDLPHLQRVWKAQA